MSECVVKMEMPRVCITENGYYGYCPMDRVWCIKRNAPSDITMREAYEAMTDNIPSWCPIICQLPEGHGRLVDGDELYMTVKAHDTKRAVNQVRSGVIEEKHICLHDICQVQTIVPAEAERSETCLD